VPAGREQPNSSNPRPWSLIVAVGKPFLVSPRRWHAAGALGLIVALLLTLNALNVANSYVGRNFMSAIAERDHIRYVRFAVLYIAVFAASTVTGVFAQFVQDRLALMWREWMTRRMVDRYLSAQTFDWIGDQKRIDNPHARISEDVKTFTTTLLAFVVMLTNAALTTVAFAGVLWSITPVLFVTALGYAAVGSAATVLLGYRLVGLNNLQLKKEADFRYDLIQFRELDGRLDLAADDRKARRIRGRLRRVIRNSKAMIDVTRNVGLFTSGYNYLIQLLPILIVAPRFLRGQIALGVVTQSAMAFAQILGAFSLIVVQFQSVSAFAAVIKRVGALWDEMERSTVNPETGRRESHGAGTAVVVGYDGGRKG
jgi:putative ATP-binding cassette transporter